MNSSNDGASWYENKRFLRHEPCPDCGSRDNRSVWWNETLQGETWYCYTCRKGKADVDLAREQGLGGIVPPGEPLSEEKRIELGLKRETVTKYDIRQSGSEIYFPYRYPNGKCVDVKVRDYSKPKDEDYHFYFKHKSKDRPLYGMHCCSARKHLILTTGEWDAPAAHDLIGWNAVHVGGDAEAVKQVKKHLDWIDQFESIFVVFDNDISGQNAAHAVCELIGYKAYNVLLPSYSTEHGVTKDAKDYLRSKLASEFQSACWSAKSQRPNYIVDHDDYVDELHAFLSDPEQYKGYATGIQPLDDMIGGLRLGEVSVIMAAPGAGKSTIGRFIIANLIESKLARCLYISLEERSVIARTRVAETILQQQIIRRGESVQLTREELATLVEPLRDNLLNTNFIGTLSEDSVIQAITYAAKGSDVKFVLLDHIGAATNDSDQMWKTISNMMDKLNQLAMELCIHISIITHSGRRSPEFEHLPPRMQDAFGSSGIERYTHVFLALMRTDNCIQIHVLKNRLWGDLGVLTVYYEKGRYYGSPTVSGKENSLSGGDLRQHVRSGVRKDVSVSDTKRERVDLSATIPPSTEVQCDFTGDTCTDTGTSTSQDNASDSRLLCEGQGGADVANRDKGSHGPYIPAEIEAVQQAAPGYLLTLPNHLSERHPTHPRSHPDLLGFLSSRAENGVESTAQQHVNSAENLVGDAITRLIRGVL